MFSKIIVHVLIWDLIWFNPLCIPWEFCDLWGPRKHKLQERFVFCTYWLSLRCALAVSEWMRMSVVVCCLSAANKEPLLSPWSAAVAGLSFAWLLLSLQYTVYSTPSHTYIIHTNTHLQTRTHANTHTHTRTSGTHRQTDTHTRTHARTHAHARDLNELATESENGLEVETGLWQCLTSTFKDPCWSTLLGILESREFTQQRNGRAKQPIRLNGLLCLARSELLRSLKQYTQPQQSQWQNYRSIARRREA